MNNIFNGNITIWQHDLNLSRSIGRPYTVKPGTTLNDILDIAKSGNSTTVYPILSYYAIGVGGVKLIDNTNYNLSRHSAKDVQPFDMIPFILREPDNDIDNDIRKQYAFRKEIIVDGKNYIAYYLKRIQDIVSRSEFFKINKNENNRDNLSVFNTNNEEVLHPKPIDREEMLNHPERGTLIVKTNKFLFSLTEFELEELDNVMKILNKGSRLTEIAICNAIKSATSISEPTKVQVGYYATCNIEISSKLLSSTPVNLYLEVGSNEPYL